MDFIFDLSRTQSGHDGIWTVIDRFSKQVHFILVKKTVKPDHLARLFVAQIFRLHGMPETIVSDRDPRFTSLFWKEIWENIGTRLQFSSSFHPQTDGQSEIANSVVLDLLKSYISDQKTQGERYLPLVEFAYNNTIHSSTGKVPFEIVEGAMKVPPFLSTKDKIFEADEYTRDLDTAFAKITERINDVSFRLRLPDIWKIHNAFQFSCESVETFGDVPDDGEPDGQPAMEHNEEILVPEPALAHKVTTKGVESTYLWQGKVETDYEVLLIIKTRESLLQALTQHVVANHKYEVPEVIALPIIGGNPSYIKWLEDSTKAD
ncbi:hypothetical protein L7F22_003644 [Adiantum nelumboides]|nr:hypothetical protein [Adiantum nelumboides]